MFYAQFVLSKKGPLAKIWLAAHWEKKLSKAQIYETSVQDAVDEILKPKVKMALRTTGHLLLGIVRIYSRKAKYLLADCNEAFLKIKMAFRPGQVDMTEEGRQAASTAINLPEVFHDFDAALPDFNDLDVQAQMHINQSRIDDITLKEDLIPESTEMPFGGEFGGDDFGENSIGFFGDDLEAGRERSSEVIDHLEVNHEASGATTLGSSPTIAKPDAFTARHIDIALGDHLGMPEPDEDFADFGTDNMLDDVLFNESELAKGIDAMEAPGAEHEIPMETEEMGIGAIPGIGVAPSVTSALLSESFALEPLDATAMAMAGMEKTKPKRKRRLIIDEQKNISGDEMKANMADYRDTLQPLDLAPPTKKLMRLKESGNVERLFNNPGCASLRAAPLLKLYRSHLVLRSRNAGAVSGDEIRRDLEMVESVEEGIEPEGSIVSGFMLYRSHLVLRSRNAGAVSGDEIRRDLEMVESVEEGIEPEGSILYRSHLVLRSRNAGAVSGDEIRRDLEMVESVEEGIEPEGSIVSGFMDDRMDDFEELGGGGLSPMGSPMGMEPVPEEEPQGVAEEALLEATAKEPLAVSDKKKERRSRAERTIEEEEGAGEADDDHRWTKRTQNVLNSISTKLKSSATEEITLSDLLTKGSTRKTAAQKFYTLLVLKKWQAIDVKQDEPYGEIIISAGPNIAVTSIAS
uniref:Rad21_Rec8_N domain-containing protein n=1 Tax=Ascaris lumbricoides TaxID=6252 RepID=A0A0M3I0B6_ASCLU